MCGIFGFVGKPTEQTPTLLTHLGKHNISRGYDSTGIACITGERTITYKNAVDAYAFFNHDPKVRNHLAHASHAPFAIILGHTRAATRGAVTAENAHPFWIGDYIITHNGIINNFDALQNEYETDYQVDSQIIAEVLNRQRNAAWNRLSGWFTVPHVDLRKPDILQVAIHKGIFSFAYKGNQLYYTSDITHLKNSMPSGAGWQLCQGGENVLYTFTLEGNRIAIGKQRIHAAFDSIPYQQANAYSDYTDDDDTPLLLSGGAPRKTTTQLFAEKYHTRRKKKRTFSDAVSRLSALQKKDVQTMFHATNPHIRFD